MATSILKKLRKIKSGFKLKHLGVIILSLLLVLLLFYTGSLIRKSGFFRITTVKSNIPVEPVLKHYISGKSLFTVDIKKIYNFIHRKNPEYKNIQVLKEFPSSLRIRVVFRRPFAQLYLKKFYVLDREGVIINISNTDDFSKMIVIEIGGDNSKLTRGIKIKDHRLELALELIDKIKTKKFLEKLSIKNINMSFPESAYFIADGTRVIIGNDDYERKLYILESLLNESLGGNISSVEYIDLRYKKAYVGYKR